MSGSIVPTIVASDPVATAEQVCASSDPAVLVLPTGVTYLRPPREGDFFDDGSPRLFVSTEAEVWCEPNHDEVARLGSLTAAALEMLGAVGDARLVCRGPVLIVPEQLRRLADHLRTERGDSWGTALARVPELSCLYVAWMQRSGFAGAVVSEPVFRVIRTPGEVASTRLARLTTADLARGYLGVVTDDETRRFLDRDTPYGEADALAQYVPAGALVRASLQRPYDRMPRVQRWVTRVRRPLN